jgi:nucleotide-binding universal stress UspA family protein
MVFLLSSATGWQQQGAMESPFDPDQGQGLKRAYCAIVAFWLQRGRNAMKSLMLHVAHDDGFEGRLQAGLDIARRFDSHIKLVQPALAQEFVAFDMAGGAHFVAQAFEAAEKARTELKARIEADLGNEGISWEWQTIDGSSRVGILAEAARLADLAILSLDADRRGVSQPGRLLAGDLAMSSRTPVLAVPPGHSGLRFGTAIVAYEGGPEASYALRCAMPLLAACDSVVLAQVSSYGDAFPQVDAADYLARHGAKIRVEPIAAAGRTVEEQLLAAARDLGGDFLVMGAYGHSRWREALFGGVTHYVLAETKVPVLLAH